MKSVNVSKPEHAAIQRVIAAIPAGRVASYGEVAMRAGLPGRARLVGRVLGDSDKALKLPWHRVLRSSGQTAFAKGSRGFREQSQRLRAEGVTIVNGWVDLAQYGWERNLDVELWGPPRAMKKTATKVTARFSGSKRASRMSDEVDV